MAGILQVLFFFSLLLTTAVSQSSENKYSPEQLDLNSVVVTSVVFNPINYNSHQAYKLLNISGIPYKSSETQCTFEVGLSGNVQKGLSTVGFHDRVPPVFGKAQIHAPTIGVSKSANCQFRALWVKNSQINKMAGVGAKECTLRVLFFCYATKASNMCPAIRENFNTVPAVKLHMNLFGFSDRIFGQSVKGLNIGPSQLSRLTEVNKFRGKRVYYTSAGVHKIRTQLVLEGGKSIVNLPGKKFLRAKNSTASAPVSIVAAGADSKEGTDASAAPPVAPADAAADSAGASEGAVEGQGGSFLVTLLELLFLGLAIYGVCNFESIYSMLQSAGAGADAGAGAGVVRAGRRTV